MKCLHYATDGKALGFYDKSVHKDIPEPYIEITENLWQKCLEHSDSYTIDVSQKKLIIKGHAALASSENKETLIRDKLVSPLEPDSESTPKQSMAEKEKSKEETSRLTAERQAAHEVHHIAQTLREKLTAALTQVHKIESATLEAMEKADDLADLDTLVQQMQSQCDAACDVLFNVSALE